MDLTGIQFPLRNPNGSYLGMTTREEQDWCRRFASETFSGKGALVELGCFFGSLSIPFAEGMAEAVAIGRLTQEQAILNAYDLFYWHHSMIGTIAGTPLEGRIHEGEWFVDVYRENVRHLEKFINLTWGDLGKKEWQGGPIEFLLLDCLKYDAITNNVIKHFFPSTVPGLSRLGHQDYFHFYEWWTHVITYEQRDLLSIEEEIPDSGMLILRVEKDLAGYCAAYDANRHFKSTSPELIEDAYAWNFSVISPEFHDALLAAKIWAYAWIDQLETAQKLYAEASSKFQQSYSFGLLRDYCRSEGIPLL